MPCFTGWRRWGTGWGRASSRGTSPYCFSQLFFPLLPSLLSVFVYMFPFSLYLPGGDLLPLMFPGRAGGQKWEHGLTCERNPFSSENRFSRDRPHFNDTLDVIKFVCKDLWTLVFRKQVDNLKTNHRVCAIPPPQKSNLPFLLPFLPGYMNANDGINV